MNLILLEFQFQEEKQHTGKKKIFDFYKKILYNIYVIKIKTDTAKTKI
jgi:hypothetical protein